MKIEVGEYVRIDKDYRLIALGIAKVVRISNEAVYIKTNFEMPISMKKDNILKHSKNIIDLIEVGDYVNGHLVVDIIGDEDRTEIGIESDHIIYHYVDDEKIKSIVTKEAFKSVEYIVGGKE